MYEKSDKRRMVLFSLSVVKFLFDLNPKNMASLSLWLNGIPNIGLHSYLLYATTWAYSAGIRPDLFSYYLTNLYRK